MPIESWREEFANFLDRLSATRGRVSVRDWQRYVVTHYQDEPIEEIRRTVARLGANWANRDWPDLNCELVSEWAEQIRGSRSS